jgi:hypothetical protein
LLACIVELQSQIAEQQRQIAILTAHTEVFQAEIERLKRSVKRPHFPRAPGLPHRSGLGVGLARGRFATG